MIRCPQCLSSKLRDGSSIDIQPHGERTYREFYICWVCGAAFDETDAVTIPEIIINMYEQTEEGVGGE